MVERFFRGREVDYVENTTSGLESKFSYDTLKLDLWYHQDWGSLSTVFSYSEKRAETLSNDEFGQFFHDSFYEYGAKFAFVTRNQEVQAELELFESLIEKRGLGIQMGYLIQIMIFKTVYPFRKLKNRFSYWEQLSFLEKSE